MPNLGSDLYPLGNKSIFGKQTLVCSTNTELSGPTVYNVWFQNFGNSCPNELSSIFSLFRFAILVASRKLGNIIGHLY